MNTTRAILAAMLLLAGSWAAAADSFPTVEATRIFADECADAFGTGDYDAAFKLASKYWIFPISEMENLKAVTIKQLNMVRQRFGNPIGAEFIKKEQAGDSLIRYSYLIKHERHALRLIITVYSPKDIWLLNAFSWDDEIADLLD